MDDTALPFAARASVPSLPSNGETGGKDAPFRSATQVPKCSGLTRVRPLGYVARFRCENARCALWHDAYVARIQIERGPGGRLEYVPVETDRCAGCGEPGDLLSDLGQLVREGRAA